MKASRLPTLLILLGSLALTIFFGWMLWQALHNDDRAYERDLEFQAQEQGITVSASRAGLERRVKALATTLATDPAVRSIVEQAAGVDSTAQLATLRRQLAAQLSPYWQTLQSSGALSLAVARQAGDVTRPFLELDRPMIDGGLVNDRGSDHLLRESRSQQQTVFGIGYDGRHASTIGVAPIMGGVEDDEESTVAGLLALRFDVIPNVDLLAQQLGGGVAVLRHRSAADGTDGDAGDWRISQTSGPLIQTWLREDLAIGNAQTHLERQSPEGASYLLTLIPLTQSGDAQGSPVAAVAVWKDITTQVAQRDGLVVNTWVRWGLAWLIAEACLLLLLWGTRRATRDTMLAHQRRLESQTQALESLNRRLEAQKETLETLNDIAALQETSFQRLVEKALQAGAEHLGMPFAVANRIEGEDYLIEAAYSPDQRFEPGQHLATSDTFCSLTMASDDVVAFADADADGLADHRCRLRYELKSYIGAPIWVQGKRFGALAFSSDQPHPRRFDEIDEEFVRLLARWVGATLTRWRDVQAREEISRRLAKIASQTPGMIFQYRQDADGRPSFPYASDAIKTFYGLTPAEAAADASQVFERIVEEDLERVSASIEESRVTLTTWNGEYRVRKENGDLIWLAGQSIPEREPDGGTLWHGFLHDVTERKRNERLKGEFISTVSHELRTPLTSISGSLGLIQGGALGQPPETMRSMLTVAHSNAQRLILLINDLLDMEKLVAGKMTFQMQEQPLMALIDHAIESNQAYADQYRAHYVVTERMDHVDVNVDAMRLQQVMSNLLSNAAKFSPPDSQVEVRVEPIADRVRVSVIDHGPGIPEAFHHRIFQKFSQADGSSTRKQGGTGLGLAITRELVERMRGTINFFSEEGHGACFFIELPRLDRQPAPAGAASVTGDPERVEAAETLPAPGSRLLIVEDDPDTATLLAILVRQWGYRAEVAHTLDEALGWLERRSFDAITLDLMLPDGNGLTLLRQLREQPQTRDLPVLVVSATAEEGQLEIGGQLNAVDWLAKPFDEKRLAASLQSSLRLSSRRQRIMHVESDAELTRRIAAQLAPSMTLDVARSMQEARYLLDSNEYGLISLDLTGTHGPGWELIPLLSETTQQPAVIILSDQALAPSLLGKVDTAIAKPGLSAEALMEAFDRQLNHAHSVASPESGRSDKD
ncbi:ATP-binding protein [Salinicola rhizosphaerae]|uniref:histidine kinase n=1 Tax=Salinicola rhizosphaerae TaxID=1443141 RepID=A0ABQ3E0P9_9GAMM|nr:ATP-binding protein [Salinicola rhizosphaerae]GHB22572.1 hypothetical protein GCM10009038_21920 [Salinicola rhizosphaerae]